MKFLVENMSCGHCSKAILQAIQQMDAHASVEVKLLEKQVEVQNTHLDENKIKEILQLEGYPATSME